MNDLIMQEKISTSGSSNSSNSSSNSEQQQQQQQKPAKAVVSSSSGRVLEDSGNDSGHNSMNTGRKIIKNILNQSDPALCTKMRYVCAIKIFLSSKKISAECWRLTELESMTNCPDA